MKNSTRSFVLFGFMFLTLINQLFGQCTGPGSTALYVVPNGTGSGTAASPANLLNALNIYRADNSRTPILLAGGDYYLYNTINVPTGVTIEGAYSHTGASWVKDPGAITNLNINPPFKFARVSDVPVGNWNNLHYDTVTVAHIIGLELDSVQDIFLRDFHMSVWNNGGVTSLPTRDGFTIYAIYADHAHNVQLRGLDITTGDAQRGGFGLNGLYGSDAVWYTGGGYEIDYDHSPDLQHPAFKLSDGVNSSTAGGVGGFGSAVQNYVQCSGPSCLTHGCELENPAPVGHPGQGPSGGGGGTCGDACRLDCYLEDYLNYLTPATAIELFSSGAVPPFETHHPDGHPGSNGGNGHDGTSVPGLAQPYEYQKYFVPGPGSAGDNGTGGSGGGGGGAGGIRVLYIPSLPPGASAVAGAAKLPIKAMQLSILGAENIANAIGSGADMCHAEILNLSTEGGPGGGGGEGGGAGGGGGGGGGVFGIYAYHCNNMAAGDLTYHLGDPGEGGHGGHGAPGGLGAPGLPGPDLVPEAAFFSNQGAVGGNGGNGGAGSDGQDGSAGKKYETWGMNEVLVFSVDTAHACTNSMIGIAKGSQSNLQAFVNGFGITPITNTPGYVEYSVANPTTIHFIQTDPHNNNSYAFHNITVTQQRALPVFSIPATLCVHDTLSLIPADTTLAGYRWKIYQDTTLLVDTREKSFRFIPPSTSGTVTYHITLQSFESCCGWSTPVEHLTTIEQPLTLTIAWTGGDNGHYCAGTDSTRITLTGAPSHTTGTFPYITTYPGLTWSTGDTSVNQIWVQHNGTYSATYVSPNGCASHSQQNYTLSNVYEAPTSVPVTQNAYNGCDYSDISIYPQDANSWWYNFYLTPTSPNPLTGGYHSLSYTFTPSFGHGSGLKDSIIIYVASVSDHGCVGAQRGPAVIFHEKNPPLYLPPFADYYYQNTVGNLCGAPVTYQIPTGADDCSPYVNVNRIQGPAPGGFFPVGLTTVIHRLTDGFGNINDVYTTVEVVDTTSPVIYNLLPDFTYNASPGACSYTTTPLVPYAIDNCSGTLAPTTYWSGFLTNDSVFGVGTTLLTYEFRDSSYNLAVGHTSVTVIDNQPPVLTCPADKTYYITGSDTSVYTFYNLPTVTDNCYTGYLPVTLASGFGQSGYHPLGGTTETWSATDHAGNTGTCSFNVEVRDTIRPVITCPDPVYLTTDIGLSYTHVNYTIPTATDNLPGPITIAHLNGKSNGDTASIGVYTAIWTGTDTWGNVGSCPVTITISDNQGPLLICPNNMNVTNDQGACSAVINYTVAPALDNDLNYYNPALYYGLASGAAFPMGTTNVVYTVADAQNNRSYCAFNVTVVDNIAPVFTNTCPHDTTVDINPQVCGKNLPVPTLTGSDNSCFAPSIGFVEGSPGGFYQVGTTKQTYRITDNAGNSNTCIYYVTVVDNNTFSATCPPNITRNNDPGLCTAYIPYYGTPVLLPNYGCAITTLVSNPGPDFPVGTTQLIYHVTALAQFAQCFQTITVVDNEGPHITSPANIVAGIDPGTCGKTINFTAPVGTDNCNSGAGTFLITGLASGSVFPIGSTLETYVVSDVVDHTDTARFTITVRDTVAPVIVAPANVTASTSDMCGTIMNFTAPIGTDNSNCAVTNKVAGLNPGDLFPIGTTTEIYVVTDGAGLTDTCMFNVTVSPIYPLQSNCLDHWLQADPVGYGAVVYYPVPGVTDQYTGQPNPCPGVDVILQSGQGSGAFFSPGPHYEEYDFVVRSTGDTVHCTTNVVVTEFVPPVIDCGPTQVYNLVIDSGLCTATFHVPAPTVSDGPNGGYITLIHQVDYVDDTSEFYTFSGGLHSINYRAIDYSGNSSYCSIYVNVTDDVHINNPLQGSVTYCENEMVNLDPQISGYATGLTYEWRTTDSVSNYYTFSTDKILHFDAIKLTDQKQYSFRVYDRCGTAIMGGEISILVVPGPATTLTGLNSNYCTYDSANIAISFTPAGGVLAGSGISGNNFNPRNAGVGSHDITYAWYDGGTGCTGISRKTVVVSDAPVVTPFADSLYCINAGIIQLPAPNSSYLGSGITGTTFNTFTAGGGNHVITRTVTINGCTSQLAETVRVNTVIPNSTITAPASICEASGNYPLTVATGGGTWSGNSLIIDTATGHVLFDSRASGKGTDTVMYTVTQSACTSRDTAFITVRDKAYNLAYTFPQFCTTDAPVLFDTTDNKKYLGLGFINSMFHPDSVGFAGPMFYIVVTTNNYGCVDTNFRMLNLRGGLLNVYTNQFVCERGDTISVNLESEYDSIVWYNGSHSNLMTFTDTGSYSVFLRDTMGCYGHDTMFISLNPVPAHIVTSTSVVACPNSTGLITTDSTLIHFVWSNGDTTPSVNVSPGTYHVTVTTMYGCEVISPPVTVTTGPDVVLPTITCAPDTVLYAPAGSCSLSGINLVGPSALDNCGIASVTSNAPVSYTVGTTNVTWTARDNSNNASTCIQHVTVHDTIVPFFTNAPVTFIIDTALNNCSSPVPNVIGLFTASDSCSAVTITQSPVAGTFVTTGITPVAVTAHDVSGNTAVYYIYYQATDTVAPVITCPGDMSATAVGVNTTAVVSYTAPSGASNCSNTTVQRIAGLGSGAAFPVGVTTEKYVVTDGAGATDTCSFNITVTHVTGITENNDNGSSLTVMPVPALDQLTVIYKNSPATSIQVKLTNATGQLVISDQQIPFDGTYNKILNVNEQPAGTYILEITTEHETITRKIVKL